MPRHCCCGCWGLRNWSPCSSVAPQDISLPEPGQHQHGDDSCSSKQAFGLCKPLAPTASSCLKEPSQHWRTKNSILNPSLRDKHWPTFTHDWGMFQHHAVFMNGNNNKKKSIYLIERLVFAELVPLFCIVTAQAGYFTQTIQAAIIRFLCYFANLPFPAAKRVCSKYQPE